MIALVKNESRTTRVMCRLQEESSLRGNESAYRALVELSENLAHVHDGETIFVARVHEAIVQSALDAETEAQQ